MNLMLLAAGLGTRLKPFTDSHPKPTIPFLNVPMGLYQLQYLQGLQSTLSSFVVNTHHLPEQIEELYRSQNYLKIEPKFSYEAGKILGNGGALSLARPLFKPDTSILLMNADEVYFSEDKDYLLKMMEQHKESKALATLAVIKHPEAGKKFGAIWCKKNAVEHIGKAATDSSLAPMHYIGVCILSWDVLKLVKPNTEQNILYDVLFPYLNRVRTFELNAAWYETGNKEDLLSATETVLEMLPSMPALHDFINKYDPSDLVLSSLVSKSQYIVAKDLSGFNCISKTAQILKDSHFENSIAFHQQIIK